jgi:hypothetical protein
MKCDYRSHLGQKKKCTLVARYYCVSKSTLNGRPVRPPLFRCAKHVSDNDSRYGFRPCPIEQYYIESVMES